MIFHVSPVSSPTKRHARPTPAIAALVAVLLLSAACNSTKSHATKGSTLPAGVLLEYVPQPSEVPAGLQPVLAQSGPADVSKLASFSGNAATAQAALTAHGFQIGYVVEYANPTSGQLISVVVSRFATALGATQDLSSDLSAKQASTVKPITVPQIGDQSGADTQPLPGGASGSQLITIRFRLDDMTWLLAVGSTGKVDISSVTQIALFLVQRAHAIATASPAP